MSNTSDDLDETVVQSSTKGQYCALGFPWPSFMYLSLSLSHSLSLSLFLSLFPSLPLSYSPQREMRFNIRRYGIPREDLGVGSTALSINPCAMMSAGCLVPMITL
jgi:hypothetical protein